MNDGLKGFSEIPNEISEYRTCNTHSTTQVSPNY
jgi:hypothetical protein